MKLNTTLPDPSHPLSVSLQTIELTSEPIADFANTEYKKLPNRVKEELNELFALVHEKPKQAIPRLEKLRTSHPNAPQISNYLCAAYDRTGKKDKMRILIKECYKQNPKYLFARVNYAEICLREGKPEAIPEIFEHTFSLQALYPKRKQFHTSEAVAFFGILGRYYNATDNSAMAENIYQVLKEINPNAQMTQQLKHELIARPLQTLFKRMESFLSKSKTPSSNRKKS